MAWKTPKIVESAGWHGNQHVRLCGPQISSCDSSAFRRGWTAICDDAPDPGTANNIGGHLRNVWKPPRRMGFASSFRLAAAGGDVPQCNRGCPRKRHLSIIPNFKAPRH